MFFKTHIGRFEYLVMPFRLTNTPAVFHNMVNNVPSDLLHKLVFVYLDDILIYSSDLETNKIRVRKVLQCLHENRLYVKAEGCEFNVPTVTFLGYVFEVGQVRMDPLKTKAVEEWTFPESRKQLQQFLGFANFYRRFIKDFSIIAAPLTVLTTVKRLFSWTPEAYQAFTELKQRFIKAPILIQTNPYI